MTSQEAQDTPDVVTGTLSILCDDARVLIDLGLHTLLFHVSMLHKSGRLQFL